MSEEDTPMDDDALLDGWDAYVSGRANGLDRLNSQDREVIEMLHTRTWSPTPRQSFTSDLRTRLAAGSTGDKMAAPVAPRPTQQPPSSIGSGRPTAWRRWQRVALAAMLIAALTASFARRLADDPPAPTVQAPVAQVTTNSSSASPVASPGAGWAACAELPTDGTGVMLSIIDPDVAPELATPLALARYATIQKLTAVAPGDAIPNSYYTSGVTGVVIDTVVTGAVSAQLTTAGTLQTVSDESGGFQGTPIGPLQRVDVLQGDSLIYPVGSLMELTNTLETRNLSILRVVLHDVRDMLAGRVSDTVTLETSGHGAFPADAVVAWGSVFALSLDYVAGLPVDHAPLAPCRSGEFYYLAQALGPVEYDDGPRLHGLVLSIQPLQRPGGLSAPTPTRSP